MQDNDSACCVNQDTATADGMNFILFSHPQIM